MALIIRRKLNGKHLKPIIYRRRSRVRYYGEVNDGHDYIGGGQPAIIVNTAVDGDPLSEFAVWLDSGQETTELMPQFTNVGQGVFRIYAEPGEYKIIVKPINTDVTISEISEYKPSLPLGWHYFVGGKGGPSGDQYARGIIYDVTLNASGANIECDITSGLIMTQRAFSVVGSEGQQLPGLVMKQPPYYNSIVTVMAGMVIYVPYYTTPIIQLGYSDGFSNSEIYPETLQEFELSENNQLITYKTNADLSVSVSVEPFSSSNFTVTLFNQETEEIINVPYSSGTNFYGQVPLGQYAISIKHTNPNVTLSTAPAPAGFSKDVDNKTLYRYIDIADTTYELSVDIGYDLHMIGRPFTVQNNLGQPITTFQISYTNYAGVTSQHYFNPGTPGFMTVGVFLWKQMFIKVSGYYTTGVDLQNDNDVFTINPLP
jgi:hypothetical protein